MKLILFTPAIKTSTVGQMACLMTQALIAQGHQVIIIRSESASLLHESTHDFRTSVVSWNQTKQVMRMAANADAFIYQMSDNVTYHEGCLTWLPRLPGVVCLHDNSLGHLFYFWAQTHKQEAQKLLHYWYGDTLAQRFFTRTNTDAFAQEIDDIMPLTEWICMMATGVITHSDADIVRILSACAGPVYTVPWIHDVPHIETSLKTSINNISLESMAAAESYARQLVNMIKITHAIAPITAAVDQIVAQLQRWGATRPLMQLEETIAPLTLFTHHAIHKQT